MHEKSFMMQQSFKQWNWSFLLSFPHSCFPKTCWKKTKQQCAIKLQNLKTSILAETEAVSLSLSQGLGNHPRPQTTGLTPLNIWVLGCSSV